MDRICSIPVLSRIIQDDPVRPHICSEKRLGPGREVYHLDNKAYICLAYMNGVPVDEVSLLTCICGPIAVAYTVWSTKKGKGRELIFETQKMIKDTGRFKRLVTLSPKTEMAMRFHLSNGAKLISENQSSNNFEYEI